MTREIFSFKNHAGNKEERLVPDLFFLKKKDLYEVKQSGLSFLISIYFDSPQLCIQ